MGYFQPTDPPWPPTVSEALSQGLGLITGSGENSKQSLVSGIAWYIFPHHNIRLKRKNCLFEL